MIKLSKINIFAVAFALFFAFGCKKDSATESGNGYGYVQFKLYKEASYVPADATRGSITELERLAEACKVEVNLTDVNNRNIRQTLVLSASDAEAAEFGLRSDKLKLLTGEYTLDMITLFDALDEVVYRNNVTTNNRFVVKQGGLTVHDVTVNVTPRGKVQFTLVKDFSAFENIPTRSERPREYAFDEVKFVDIALKVVRNGKPFGEETILLEDLPVVFSQHFDEEDYQSDKHGYKTSTLRCETPISLEADTYRVVSYTTKSKKSSGILEVNSNPPISDFTIEDNQITEAKVKVALFESDEYIKDGYALYEIWKSLDGENWCYDGESYPRGANWNFNKDVDLWCEQPGVQIHANGRVASLDLSNFGFRGDMSPAIGQLTELRILYLGTHNDTNIMYDPSIDLTRPLEERQRTLIDDQRAYLRAIHPAIQMSEPCAFALMYKGRTSPAISSYENGGTGSGRHTIRKFDMNHGVLKNGLRSLPKEIGRLTKLEELDIANGELVELPDSIARLVSLSSLEIYNCPKMEKFPVVIGQLPLLRTVNISNNKQWSTEEIEKGIEALAKGASRRRIEILYARENNLSKLDKEWFSASRNGFESMGLLDLSFNKISRVDALGKDVQFIQLYLDNNQIEHIPHDSEGYFCGYDDVENFSVNYNKLKKVPNIFNSKSVYIMNSVSFGGNEITGFEGEEDGTYRGIRATTLTLSMNPLKKYPKALSESNSLFEYILLSACEIDEIPAGCFSHEYATTHMSFDFSYNHLTTLPDDFCSANMPYLYGVDLSFNRFESVPNALRNSPTLTVLAMRSQRDESGARCLTEWPQGIYQHKGLRALYLGSNDLREVNDTISTSCYTLDISDNPNIVFDASDICYAWKMGLYLLYYDKTQNILNCDAMLE